jgi:hypothetical protein
MGGRHVEEADKLTNKLKRGSSAASMATINVLYSSQQLRQGTKYSKPQQLSPFDEGVCLTHLLQARHELLLPLSPRNIA